MGGFPNSISEVDNYFSWSVLISQALTILVSDMSFFAIDFLPGFGVFSLILALTFISCVAFDFLLLSPCCLDPHGLTKSLVLCSLCIAFRLSHQPYLSKVLKEKSVSFSIIFVIQKLPIILVDLLDYV